MTTPVPQWVCSSCKRTLDDHQLRNITGAWFDRPMCVEKGLIMRGIRMPGTP